MGAEVYMCNHKWTVTKDRPKVGLDDLEGFSLNASMILRYGQSKYGL